MAIPLRRSLRREQTPFYLTRALTLFGNPNFLIGSDDPVLTRELASRLKSYRDLERDAKVDACLQKRKGMTVAADFDVKPGLRRGLSTTREDRRLRDLVHEQLLSLGTSLRVADAETARLQSGLDGLYRGMLDATLMGYSVGEILYEVDSREVVATQVRWRDQIRFGFDSLHQLRFLDDAASIGGEGRLLPARKFIVYTYGSLWNPLGIGLGNRLWHLVRFKRLALSYQLHFLDKYGAPTAVHRAAPGATEEEYDSGLEKAQAVHGASAISISADENLELLQAISTAAQQGYEQLEKYLDGQISQAILGVTLTTDISGSQGSRAATQTHAEEQKYVAVADTLATNHVLTNTLSRYLTDFNSRTANAPAPRIQRRIARVDELLEIARLDAALFEMGYRRSADSIDRIYADGEGIYSRDAPARAPAPAVASAPEATDEEDDDE